MATAKIMPGGSTGTCIQSNMIHSEQVQKQSSNGQTLSLNDAIMLY